MSVHRITSELTFITIYSVALVYAPVVSYMSEWFVHKRGMANGIVFSGEYDYSTVVREVCLHKYRRCWGGGSDISPHSATTDRAIRYPQGNKGIRDLHSDLLDPNPSTHESSPSRNSCTRSRSSIFKCTSMALQQNFLVLHGYEYLTKSGASYPRDMAPKYVFYNDLVDQRHHLFPPIIAYASAVGLSTSQSSLAITVLCIASTFAGTTMGWLSDRFDIWVLAMCSLVGTCLATFIVWGVLSFSFGGIIAYAVFYGLTAGGWTSLYYGFVNPFASKWT